MGNVEPSMSSQSGRSLSTIASFVTTDTDREVDMRNPYGYGSGRVILREQLDALDYAAQSWQTDQSVQSTPTNAGGDVEEFYVHEAGNMSASRGGFRGQSKIIPDTIDEYDERAVNDDRDDEESQNVVVPFSERLDLQMQPSNEDTTSGHTPSEQSLASVENPSLRSAASSSGVGHNLSLSTESGGYVSTGSIEEEAESQTHDIVRQVQQLLFGVPESKPTEEARKQKAQKAAEPLVQSPEPSLPQLNAIPSTPNSEQSKMPSLSQQNEIPPTPNSQRSKMQFTAYIPVIAERASEEEEANEREAQKRRTRRQSLLILFLCLALVGLVLGLLAYTTDTFKSTDKALLPGEAIPTFAPSTGISTNPDVTVAPAPTESPTKLPPTASPEQDTTSVPVPDLTSQPTLGWDASLTSTPTQASTFNDTAHSSPTATPGENSKPVPSPGDVWTKSPDSSFLTPSPTEGTPSPVMPRVDTPSPTMTTTESPVMPPDTSEAKAHLSQISGSAIDNPTSPQYKAYRWLRNEDPANLDLDNMPVKALEQRYIAAVLYFSTKGKFWDNSYNFLTELDVCEWQDKETSKGIQCDLEGSIDEIVISTSDLLARALLWCSVQVILTYS